MERVVKEVAGMKVDSEEVPFIYLSFAANSCHLTPADSRQEDAVRSIGPEWINWRGVGSLA